MNSEVRQALIKLKEKSLKSPDSEIRAFARDLLVKNITALLDEDASNDRVKDCLAGGFRTIADSESPSENDPIIVLMGSIYDSVCN